MGLIIGRNFSRYIASLPPAEPEPTFASITPTVANLAQVEQIADTTKITPTKAIKGAKNGTKSSKKQGGLASRHNGDTQLCSGQSSTVTSTKQSQNVSTDANVDTTQSSSVGSETGRSTRII